jgi:hypothetical protein
MRQGQGQPFQGFPPQQGFPGAQVPPGYGPALQPPKPKSKVGLIIGIIAGVIILGVAVILMLPDPPAPAPNNPPPPLATNNQPATPPATPPTAPPATPPATDNKAQYTAKVLAKGQFNFEFQSYDGFAGNQIALARSADGGNVDLMVLEFQDGTFQEAVAATMPIGKLNDVNHGKIFNDGKDYAIAPAESGLILVPEDDDAQTLDGKGLEHVLVGDWDGDGKHETVTVSTKDGFKVLTFWRYKPDQSGEKLATLGAKAFLKGPQVIKFSDNPRNFVLGMAPDEVQVQDQLVLGMFRVNTTTGMELFGYYPLHQTAAEAVSGYAAGTVAGKPTLVAAYQPQSGNSYLEFFDISNADLNKVPPSRGKVSMPDSRSYQVVLGYFTQKQDLEILAMDPEQGTWYVIGF